MDINDLKNRFTYHPVEKEQEDKMRNLRMNFLNLALLIDEMSKDSREKSLAITHLEEALSWANKGISREK